MEALKKAERAKQGQPVSHPEHSDQLADAAVTPGSVVAPTHGFSLLPQEEAAGQVDKTVDSYFPSIAAAQETTSSIPDLAPPPIESHYPETAHIEPIIPALELTLAEPSPSRESVSPSPRATSGIEPEARPQLATSASSPLARRAEVPNKAPLQDAGKIAAAQQKAKAVFSAKQPARSRALLLLGTAAAVILGLVGFGIYYWQITSTSTMFLPASTPPPTHAATPAIPADAGPLQQQQQGTATPSAQNLIDKPVLSRVEVPLPVTAPASPPAASAAYDPMRTENRNRAESFKENPAIRIRQSAATSQLNPTLGKAYQSFLSGDTGTAQQLYHKVLQQEPNNRDALLGMAAIALKQKQAGQAGAYYGKLIELDPADPEALAGLIGLQGQSDPAQSESRLKKVLLQNPQADAVHFALGNLYTQQSRWAEAQQSYFRAYSSAPSNADYAFNLAVSLDHLNQGKLALDYYQRALAQTGPANFDKSSVQTRIKELLQPAGN